MLPLLESGLVDVVDLLAVEPRLWETKFFRKADWERSKLCVNGGRLPGKKFDMSQRIHIKGCN